MSKTTLFETVWAYSGPVGGYDIDSEARIAFPVYCPILQTVRIPLTEFVGANLSQIRGIRLIFDENQTGKINLANVRFMK